MAYTIKLKEFEGPLELLLELIESRKLDVSEVSLAQVTDGYFQYLKALEAKSLHNRARYEDLTAFLVVAATLILIKSRSLLPGFEISKEEEENIGELQRRLEELRKIREISLKLRIFFENRRPLFTRPPLAGMVWKFLPPPGFNLKELPQILKNLLETLPQKEKLPKEEVKKVVSLEEKIEELTRRIEEGFVSSFSDIIKGRKEKVDIIVTFLAMLELIKLGLIAVEQRSLFSPIAIQKYRARDGT